ncbi:MAG: hypothetical protein WAX89_01005, partial [Alphaproteobacteria bacterium]
FMSRDTYKLFNEDDCEVYKKRIRAELIPELELIIDNKASDFDNDSDVDDHFADLYDSIENIRHILFPDESLQELAEALNCIENWKYHFKEEMGKHPAEPINHISSPSLASGEEERSIFEDIDED